MRVSESVAKYRKWLKWQYVVYILIIATFLLCCLSMVMIPKTSFDEKQIEFNTLQDYASDGAMCFAILLLIICCIPGTKKLFRMAMLSFVFLFYPFSCIATGIHNLASWTKHGSISDQDGNTYAFLNSSFLQGQTMVIARFSKQTVFHEGYDILVETNGDNPRYWLGIIRSSDAVNQYGQLYLTRNNWLIGVRHNNRMYLAYDLKNNKAYAGEEILKQSPFLLIDNKQPLNPPDVQALLAGGLNEDTNTRDGKPRREAIVLSLNSPNPEIKALAEKLLDAKLAK